MELPAGPPSQEVTVLVGHLSTLFQLPFVADQENRQVRFQGRLQAFAEEFGSVETLSVCDGIHEYHGICRLEVVFKICLGADGGTEKGQGKRY